MLGASSEYNQLKRHYYDLVYFAMIWQRNISVSYSLLLSARPFVN